MCEQCGLVLARSTNLRNHQRLHSEYINKYECEECDETFQTVYNLYTHCDRAHEKRRPAQKSIRAVKNNSSRGSKTIVYFFHVNRSSKTIVFLRISVLPIVPQTIDTTTVHTESDTEANTAMIAETEEQNQRPPEMNFNVPVNDANTINLPQDEVVRLYVNLITPDSSPNWSKFLKKCQRQQLLLFFSYFFFLFSVIDV